MEPHGRNSRLIAVSDRPLRRPKASTMSLRRPADAASPARRRKVVDSTRKETVSIRWPSLHPARGRRRCNKTTTCAHASVGRRGHDGFCNDNVIIDLRSDLLRCRDFATMRKYAKVHTPAHVHLRSF